MAYKIIQSSQEKKQNRFRISMPDLAGKLGLTLNLGTHEVFIGVAVAKTEIETVVRKRRQKVFQPGKIKVVNFT